MTSPQFLVHSQVGCHHIYGKGNARISSKGYLPQQGSVNEFRFSPCTITYTARTSLSRNDEVRAQASAARPSRKGDGKKEYSESGNRLVNEDPGRSRSHAGDILASVMAATGGEEVEGFSRVQGVNGAGDAEGNSLASTISSKEGAIGRRSRNSNGDGEDEEDDREEEEESERARRNDLPTDRRTNVLEGDGRGRSWKPRNRRQTEWGSELLARRDPSFDMAVVTEMSSGQLSVTVRVLYSLAMYGGMALVGKLICDAADVDFWGGFRLDAEDFYSALLYALLPIFGSLVLHQDSVVESWAPARAIRDAEDEELVDFFVGMSTWQYTVIGSAAAMAEELFFRSAVQGGLAHAMQVASKGVTQTTYGMAAITGVIPTLVPCSQAMAAVLTALITGSMFYVISTPKDPKVVVARGNPMEMRKSVGAWHERQKLKKIYSPLAEALLSLYLSFEWIATGNIMAPMTTHALYYISTVSTGVRRIEERERTLMKKKRVMLRGGNTTVGQRNGAD